MIEVTAYNYAPEFAHGLVRDIRVRWACEEIGLPYRTRLLDPRGPKSLEYFAEQPFGQVPAVRDGGIRLFESGAILLHIAEKDEHLLPRDPVERGRAVSWLFAALNSIEPALTPILVLDFFAGGADWAAEARPMFEQHARERLAQLAQWVSDAEWLGTSFSIADVMMISVLRTVRHTDFVGSLANLAAYQARGEERAAFQRALLSQSADFGISAR